MKSQSRIIFFLIYLLWALYLINYPFNFVQLPGFFSSLNNGIIFIGGILVLIGAFNFLRTSRYPRY